MNNSFQEITEAMLKIPGLKNLVIPVERIPSDAEFQATANQLIAQLDAENDLVIEFDPNFDFSAPSPPPAQPTDHEKASHAEGLGASTAKLTSKSQRITIRISTPTLKACKARARMMGMPYQTLINNALRAAMLDCARSASLL